MVVYICQIVVRTSDSLNEESPIKMAREKFLRKCYFFHEKDNSFKVSKVLISGIDTIKYHI